MADVEVTCYEPIEVTVLRERIEVLERHNTWLLKQFEDSLKREQQFAEQYMWAVSKLFEEKEK